MALEQIESLTQEMTVYPTNIEKANAKILENKKCKDCGWPIIDACCNDSFQNYKDASEWDWWQYCSNKGCVNHEGEGVFQDTPNWIIDDNPEEQVYIYVFKG